MRPRKRFGQHFLTDPRILERIAGTLELTGSETVIEVGPGRGALTAHLLPKCAKLIAVEIDRDLVAALTSRYAADPRVQIVEGDVLDMPFGSLTDGPYSLIGNVPYYITTPILFHALERPRPAQSVFLLQREVAERIVAKPGSREYGALSVNIQALAHVEVMFRVAAGAFSPPPKVESAVIRVRPRSDPVVESHEEAGFSAFVIACFSQRRKQLVSIIRSLSTRSTGDATALVEAAGLDPMARPETLEAAEFARLYRACAG